jgi:UDP-3-O-[3-hydroxymyristoyl] glucosamine N-acyltransferase
MNATLGEIAALVGGALQGDASLRVTGLNSIREAREGDLTFVSDARYLRYVDSTRAAAILVTPEVASASRPVIHVADPYAAMTFVQTHFGGGERRRPRGIHPSAVIGEGVNLGEGVGIDAFVRIEEGCVIGAGTVLYSGVQVGQGATLGPDCLLYANATLYDRTVLGARCVIHSGAVIGADGFGFTFTDGRHAKIPQLGNVVLGDDVEVGALSAIDRATFGSTAVGGGTKIDNLVQIGHNVQIGKHCIICGNVGIAGSAILGDYVTVGAAAGINGHVEIGDRAIIAANSGVTKSVKPGTVVYGFPATGHEEGKRMHAALRSLPEALRRLRQLEQRIERVEG